MTMVLYLLVLLTGCVVVPYPVSPEVTQSEAITLSAEGTRVTVGPRRLLERVAKEIRDADPRIEIVDGLTFRDLAFPEGDWTLARLLEPETGARVREGLDVTYVVLVGAMSHEEGEPKGHFGLWIGGYGAAQADWKDRISAVVVDLRTAQTFRRISSEGRGKQTAAGLFYFVVTFPMTDSAAIHGLGEEVAEVIAERAGDGPVRIAVMAAETLHGDEANPTETPRTEAMDRRIEALQSAAEAGDAEAQLQLFYVERGHPSSLKWLCRAADQGQRHARRELAEQYVRGTYLVPRDPVQAQVWYRLAVEDGAEEYRGELDAITARLTPEQILEAERRHGAWAPGQCEQALATEASQE